jgi:serine/threonine protein kinase
MAKEPAAEIEGPPMSQQGANGREELLEGFDRAWRAGQPFRLDQFVQAFLGDPSLDGPTRHELLTELIKIDLEYRWRSGPSSERLRLEDYLRDFPELGPVERLPPQLIGEEYQVRQRWGDQPNHAEYEARFRSQGTQLREVLQRIDTYLAAEAPRQDGILRHGPKNGEKVARRTGLGRPAPHVISVDALLDALRQYRLLGPTQLDALVHDVQGRFSQPQDLAKELLQRNWLTPYQVNQLLVGRGSELVLGPYLLLQRLGEGGAGQVFKAYHQTMSRLVALKIIRQELLNDDEVVARFRREFQVLSRLNHPNVVHAYDAGAAGTGHFLAMEYVEGTDLAKLVKQCGPLPVMQACAYVRQAALGLQHAHEKGLVHRDIKPHNLIMSLREGRIKVADLGLARLAQAATGEMTAALASGRTAGTLTPPGTVMMGTADYLAPEQALEFHKADIRADIYSLGCTLWYLLVGQPPFPADTLAEKLLSHQTKEPPAIKKLRPDVPTSLASVLQRMLEKRPQDRYQTPADVAAALATFVRSGDEGDLDFDSGGWSLRAQVSTTWTMLRKFARRNKAFTAAVVAALVLLTWSSVSNYRANKRLVEERQRTLKAVPAMVEAARLAVEKQRFDNALTQLNVALAYDPEYGEARLLRGQVLIVQRDFAHARQELERCLARQPADRSTEKLLMLCSRARPGEEATLLELAYVFEQEQKMPALAEGLLKPIAPSSAEARTRLLKLYQERIENRWKGAGNRLVVDPAGIFQLELWGHGGVVNRLDILQGMPLTALNLDACSGVEDLTPLKGMPLRTIYLRGCSGVRDLTPLKGMPLTGLLCLDGCSGVQDLTPLKGMALTGLSLGKCGLVRDLAPLKGMLLTELDLDQSGVRDLSPLQGMPLIRLILDTEGRRSVRDLSPLAGMKLIEIRFSLATTAGIDELRKMRTLEKINDMPSQEFWKKYDSGKSK